MMRPGLGFRGVVCLLFAVGVALRGAPASGVQLDEKGEIKLGARIYTSARIGAEHTDAVLKANKRSLTFPVSADGHLRQNRFFAEVEFDHDLLGLTERNFGPLGLLRDLPFELSTLKYHVVYRGEGEGVYDWGPSEYRNADQFFDDDLVPIGFSRALRDQQSTRARRRLRKIAVERQRLFQAYVEAQVGDFWMRIGRQIRAWGETDAFRLIDNINPVDSSFGGFLISLDERRVPLDMLLANYYIGSLGPIAELYLEGFVALDNEVGFDPGTPLGSPWTLPNLGAPSTALVTVRNPPARTFSDARGGGQIKFNAPLPVLGEGTFSLVHYYTYLDTPQVQTFVQPGFPLAIPAGQPGAGFLALAIQSAPKVQISGATSTFTIPSRMARKIGLGGEPVIRTEIAYFKDEPRFSQAQLDPFIYALGAAKAKHCFPARGYCTGGTDPGDSWNAVIGIDMNQFITWLNPRNSFFFSTQFFYKHLIAASKRRPIPGLAPGTNQGEVLPVPEYNGSPPGLGPVQSVLVHHPVDQYLQTFLVGTSYYSGQINPSLVLFYDWSGSFVAAPGVTFSRDPFRFRIEYNYLYSSRLRGASGTSLLRDRDNVLFQLEYVI